METTKTAGEILKEQANKAVASMKAIDNLRAAGISDSRLDLTLIRAKEDFEDALHELKKAIARLNEI